MMLVSALEKGLRSEQPEYEWNDNNLHVSDLSVALELEDRKCPRALWLRMQGADKKNLTVGQLLMFKQGNNLHEVAAKLLEKGLEGTGWTVGGIEWNLDLVLPEGLTGRLDTLIRNGKRERVVDWKSQRGKSFQYLDDVKPSHKLQVQTYMMAVDAELGYIIYLDREGSNFAKQFEIERDDEKVEEAFETAKEIISGDKPPCLTPQIKVKENKSDDSVYVSQPWQCSYCEYIDVSCKGALPEALRDNNRVVAKLDDEGNVRPFKDEYEPFMEVIRESEAI